MTDYLQVHLLGLKTLSDIICLAYSNHNFDKFHSRYKL